MNVRTYSLLFRWSKITLNWLHSILKQKWTHLKEKTTTRHGITLITAFDIKVYQLLQKSILFFLPKSFPSCQSHNHRLTSKRSILIKVLEAESMDQPALTADLRNFVKCQISSRHAFEFQRIYFDLSLILIRLQITFKSKTRSLAHNKPCRQEAVKTAKTKRKSTKMDKKGVLVSWLLG